MIRATFQICVTIVSCLYLTHSDIQLGNRRQLSISCKNTNVKIKIIFVENQKNIPTPQNNLKFNYTHDKYVLTLYASHMKLKASPLQISSFCILKEGKHLEALKEMFVVANVLKTYPKIE